MIKAGKKTKAWNSARTKLKKLYQEKGIVRCEIKLKGCWHNDALGFAHRHKRKWYLGQNEDLIGDFNQTLLACANCHDEIEDDPELTESLFIKLRGEENAG